MIPYCKNNSNYTFREICCGPPLNNYDCNCNNHRKPHKNNCCNNKFCDDEQICNCKKETYCCICPLCGSKINSNCDCNIPCKQDSCCNRKDTNINCILFLLSKLYH